MRFRSGWLAALLLALVILAPRATLAQGLPPRPSPEPTAAASDEHHDATPATGTITGTVIDQTTGAPAAGVPVVVGDVTVLSDAHGNYGRDGLAPGTYSLMLALPSERGVASQGTLTVTVAEGQRVVQHLAFRSPPALTPAPPEPAAAPPAALPRTGGAEPALPAALLALSVALGGSGAWLRRRRR